MTSDLFAFLNTYTPVSAEDFEELMSRAEHCSFGKKVRLTEMGEVENYMYFILEGLTRKFFYRGKNEVITHIVKEGGIIGSAASFFSGTPSRYIVDTLEPVTALRISKEKLEGLYRSGKKWERIGRIITTHYFLLQELHQLDNIRYSTRERFVRFINENADLVLRVPQKHLASYLNIKPETFSRLKHLLVKRKYE